MEKSTQKSPPLTMADVVRLFSSPELWQIPIESFIEVYCLIFTPPEDESSQDYRPKTAHQKDLQERLKIYTDYKKLINEILSSTLLSRKKKATKDHLFQALAELVAEENFEMLSNLNILESLKYMFAVEDFAVFTSFMEDMNNILNEQTAKELREMQMRAEAERMERVREQEEELKRLKRRQEKRKGAQPTAMTEEEIALAIQISMVEEEERKQRELQLQMEEEESLKQALEASLKLSESPILAEALEQVTQRSIQTAARSHRMLQSARDKAREYYAGLPDADDSTDRGAGDKSTSQKDIEEFSHFSHSFSRDSQSDYAYLKPSAFTQGGQDPSEPMQKKGTHIKSDWDSTSYLESSHQEESKADDSQLLPSARQIADYKINKPRTRRLPLIKQLQNQSEVFQHQQLPVIPPISQTQGVKAEQQDERKEKEHGDETSTVESVEARRARLKAARDALQKPPHFDDFDRIRPQTPAEVKMKNMEEQARLQRCLKVLREAADEMFGGGATGKKEAKETKQSVGQEDQARQKMVRQFNQSQKEKLVEADEEEAVTVDMGKDVDDTFERK